MGLGLKLAGLMPAPGGSTYNAPMPQPGMPPTQGMPPQVTQPGAAQVAALPSQQPQQQPQQGGQPGMPGQQGPPCGKTRARFRRVP